ncbi:MAG: hypothetical protein II586_05645, partial [Butyrivibrio sp.]|nr:hypothetical protein [Butyrivibrio sp.]
GGGYGSDASVAGTTYIELKGGQVERDIYGGGQGGPVFDEYVLPHLSQQRKDGLGSGSSRG